MVRLFWYFKVSFGILVLICCFSRGISVMGDLSPVGWSSSPCYSNHKLFLVLFINLWVFHSFVSLTYSFLFSWLYLQFHFLDCLIQFPSGLCSFHFARRIVFLWPWCIFSMMMYLVPFALATRFQVCGPDCLGDFVQIFVVLFRFRPRK